MDIACGLLGRSPVKSNTCCGLTLYMSPYCHSARALSSPETGFYSMEKLNDHIHISQSAYPADVLNSKASTIISSANSELIWKRSNIKDNNLHSSACPFPSFPWWSPGPVPHTTHASCLIPSPVCSELLVLITICSIQEGIPLLMA